MSMIYLIDFFLCNDAASSSDCTVSGLERAVTLRGLGRKRARKSTKNLCIPAENRTEHLRNIR
jgi:hypothetical protein